MDSPPSIEDLWAESGTNEPEHIKEICVNRLKADSSLKVLCHIDKVAVQAVVDTAADVTIISERLFDRLQNKPNVVKHVKMRAAGENQIILAKQIGPVSLSLGNMSLSRLLYVAPINDEMLLGIDILRSLNAIINMGQKTLNCGEETVPLRQVSHLANDDEESVLSHIPVVLQEDLKIPSSSPI